jgi:hypothetical protein
MTPYVTIAYVVKGFCDHRTRLQALTGQHIIDVDAESEITLIEEVAYFADIVEQKWQTCGEGWLGGVWDYDMSENLGIKVACHLAEHNTLPTKEEVADMVDNLFQDQKTENRHDPIQHYLPR